MICDQTKNYKGELSMAQKQNNTNLSTLLSSYESAESDAQHAGMALRADDGGRSLPETER